MSDVMTKAERMVDEQDAASREERVAAAARRLKHAEDQEARDSERRKLKAAADARLKTLYETCSPVVTLEGHGLVVKITTVHPDPAISLQAEEGVRRVMRYFIWRFQEQTGQARGDKTFDVATSRKQIRARMEDDLRYLLKSDRRLVSIEDK